MNDWLKNRCGLNFLTSVIVFFAMKLYLPRVYLNYILVMKTYPTLVFDSPLRANWVSHCDNHKNSKNQDDLHFRIVLDAVVVGTNALKDNQQLLVIFQ